MTLCEECYKQLLEQKEVKKYEHRQGMAIAVKCGICSKCKRRKQVENYDKEGQ